jgi:hypothetical protein
VLGVTVQISVVDALGNVGVSDEIAISQASASKCSPRYIEIAKDVPGDTSCIIHNEATFEIPRHGAPINGEFFGAVQSQGKD